MASVCHWWILTSVIIKYERNQLNCSRQILIRFGQLEIKSDLVVTKWIDGRDDKPAWCNLIGISFAKSRHKFHKESCKFIGGSFGASLSAKSAHLLTIERVSSQEEKVSFGPIVRIRAVQVKGILLFVWQNKSSPAHCKISHLIVLNSIEFQQQAFWPKANTWRWLGYKTNKFVQTRSLFAASLGQFQTH